MRQARLKVEKSIPLDWFTMTTTEMVQTSRTRKRRQTQVAKSFVYRSWDFVHIWLAVLYTLAMLQSILY